MTSFLSELCLQVRAIATLATSRTLQVRAQLSSALTRSAATMAARARRITTTTSRRVCVCPASMEETAQVRAD